MSQPRPNNTRILLLCVFLLAVCFTAGYLLVPRGKRPFVQPPAAPDVPAAANGVPAIADPGPVLAPEIPVRPKNPHLVYQNDFTSPPGDEWNFQLTSTTLKGQRPYLGDFFPDRRPALALKALPPHKLIRFTFDLFLMKSWDGSSPIWGPGLVDCAVGGNDGRILMHATFSNCGFFSDNNEQSFPDNYPALPHAAWTLGTENQSLGTEQSWGGPDRTFDCSAVYHMVYTFPHTASGIVFEFQSHLPDNPDKPFGLANVQVEALPELAAFSPAELAHLWADLGGTDAQAFYEAHWKLVSAGDAAAEYIAKHYLDLPIPDTPKMVRPAGRVKPYPTEPSVIHRERARWVLEAIHTPTAMAIKEAIPTVLE